MLLALVRGDRSARGFAVLVGAADLALSLLVFVLFDSNDTAARFQLVDRFAWIDSELFSASYFMGVDGLNTPMVLLTGLLGLCALLASWRIEFRVREFFAWLLVLQTAVMGVFVSLDLLLFFLFWELELVPMYMLISVWGQRAQRVFGHEVPNLHYPGQCRHAGGDCGCVLERGPVHF